MSRMWSPSMSAVPRSTKGTNVAATVLARPTCMARIAR